MSEPYPIDCCLYLYPKEESGYEAQAEIGMLDPEGVQAVIDAMEYCMNSPVGTSRCLHIKTWFKEPPEPPIDTIPGSRFVMVEKLVIQRADMRDDRVGLEWDEKNEQLIFSASKEELFGSMLWLRDYCLGLEPGENYSRIYMSEDWGDEWISQKPSVPGGNPLVMAKIIAVPRKQN